jgi:putative ABC transport system permease protein
MSAPRWTRTLLERLAEPGRAEEVVGDLEEAHAARVERLGRVRATVLTSLEALDVARALRRERRRRTGRSPVLAVSWLDVKLGVRMVVKHPALSIVSALGMTIAVAIGASAFGAIRAVTASSLPFDEGDRIVTIQNTGTAGFEQRRQTHLHDLETWRAQSRTIGTFGAYRIATRNLVTGEGEVAPTRVIEMTASGFEIARVPPLLGRTLIASDEVDGAPAVAVIGHGVWQDRFGGREDVLGRTLQIGATLHTIVGVMPEGFAFPINNRVWVPLRLRAIDYAPGAAPEIDVFGRLAPGFSLSDAQAEMEVVGQQLRAAAPETHGTLRVFPYTQELFWGPMAWFLYVGQLMVSMLLVVIAINVAALVYARTATRSAEVVVRSALGASRARVVSQLFVEALVLSSFSAALGLLIAGWGLEQIELVVAAGGEQMPFWWDFTLTPATALYSFGLAVVAAVIIGVVPALRVTGAQLRAGLQTIAAGSGGPRLGRVWTTLIVTQVAGAVAILPLGLNALRFALRPALVDTGLPSAEFLMAELTFEEEALAGAAGDGATATDVAMARRATLDALVQRLENEREVAQVFLIETSPWADPDLRFQLEGAAAQDDGEFAPFESAGTGTRVGLSQVSPDFLTTFGARLVGGRMYDARDVATGTGAVVVNQVFVDLALGGRDPVGRRIRFGTSGAPAPGSPEEVWHTIVGVVEDHWGPNFSRPEAKAFMPMTPESMPGELAIRLRSDPASYVRRLREMAAGVDPKLQLASIAPLDDHFRRGRSSERLLGLTIATVTLSVLLLSVAGLYALMSFTVVRRHREIGIRSALGAKPHVVVRTVLARAMAQLAVGILIGVALSGLLDRAAGGEMLSGKAGILLPLVAVLMTIVGVAAAWGPARRGLRIQPTEALRAE